MGFSLRNMLHEAIAQANPFDGGQTAHTVAVNNPIHTAATPATNNFQRGWDQVNPFDNGRTWQAPTPQQQPQSVIHQITHNGVTNAGGDVIHSVTNVPAAPVNMLRGMYSQYISKNQGAAKNEYDLAMQDARNNLVTGLGEQAANSVKGFILDPAVSLLTPDGSIAHQIAEDQKVQDLNKTPFGQLLDPVQHKAAEFQVHRDLKGLTPEQQKQAINANEAQAGLDPTASFGKQLLTSGLSALQLATADKIVNGVPIKEDLAAKTASVKTAVPQIIQAAQDSKVPQIISAAKNAVTDTTHDIVRGKPYRNINDEELAAANKVRSANQGMGSPMDITDQDMAHYYSAMKKAGATNANDVKALDDAIGARQSYQTRQDYMNSPEVKEGGYIRPDQIHRDIAGKFASKPQPAIPPHLQALAEEAKKYKSADEFVKSFTDPSIHRGGMLPTSYLKTPKKLYRGVNTDGNGVGSAGEGLGLYTTTDKKTAMGYAKDGGKLLEMNPATDTPKNPLYFRNPDAVRSWIMGVAQKLGLRVPEFNEKIGIENLVNSLGHDGVAFDLGNGVAYSKYGKTGHNIFNELGVDNGKNIPEVSSSTNNIRPKDGVLANSRLSESSSSSVLRQPIDKNSNLTDLYNQTHANTPKKPLFKPLNSEGKALVSEDGSVIPTVKNLAGKDKQAQADHIKNPFADPNNTDDLITKGKQALGNLQKEMDKNDKLMKETDGTADTLPGEKATAAATKIMQKDKKTGIVDKQLNQIEKARKDVINYTANELKTAASGKSSVLSDIRNAGGISKSDYETLPQSIKNKNGLPMDELAANLGYKDDAELYDAIQHHLDNGTKPMSKAEALAEAEKQLESGKHPYSADYQQIKDALKQRQDELSLYPKGTRAEVKISDKAPNMSDEELASLSKQPEAQVKPAGRKIVKVDESKELRNADAERQVVDDLTNNRGTDTAIENYQKATGATLQKAVHDINRVAKEADLHTDLGKNPVEGKVLLPHVEEGNWKQATLNARFVQSKELELGGQALDSYKALSPKDQVLLKDIETGTVRQVAEKAENPAAFKQAEHDIRNYYDHRHAYDRALGIDVGYRTNYLRQLFDRVEQEPEVKPTGDEQLRGGGGNKNPAYTKERSFDTLGADVGNALERDIKGSSFNHAKLTYEKGLNEAFPGKIANGEIPRSTNAGVYQQIDHPFGNDLSAPKDIAHEINSRVWHQNDSKTLDVYDKLNHGFKYVKLSGGLFHAFTESGNFVGQQLASGKLFTDPAATGRMAKVFFSQGAMDSELTRMADHGVLDKAHLAGLTTSPKEILADANVSALDKAKNATNAVAKYSGVKAMHDATFKREIPYAKLKIFEQRTEGLNPAVPADLAKMRTTAEAVNNLFGGINREVQGMKPGTFRWVQRALLATDFTEGKWVTLAKAMSDKGEAGTIARQAVVGKALLFGLVATAGAALGGDYQGKTKGQIAKDAAGNLLDPSFEMGGYKVGLPKTHISEAIGAFKPTQNNGKAWNASGLVTYGQDRAAALPSEAIQLLSNKNYYGQPLYGTNTKKNGGGKINPVQAASNIAQTVLPIPVGQAATTAQGKQNPAAAVANVIGFKAKPNSDNNVTLQGTDTQLNDKQAEAYHGQVNTTLKGMQQQLTSSSAYKNANPNDQAKMMSDLKSNVTSAVSRDFASKNNLGQFAPGFTGKDSKASTKEQDILTGKINPDSYAPNSSNTDSFAVSQFKKSNKQTTTIGKDTYYKTSDGTVKHQATFDYNIGIDNAKADFALDRYKATGNYNAWQTTAQQKYDLIQKQIDHLNANSQQADILKLRKQQADLVDTAQKYSEYGGFTKPKSGKSQAATLQKNAFTYNAPKSSNDSLRSLLASARISSPGSGRRIKAKQVVKVA